MTFFRMADALLKAKMAIPENHSAAKAARKQDADCAQ